MHPLTGKILRVSEWAVELENEWDKMPDTRKLCPHWDSRDYEYPKSKRHSNPRYNFDMIEIISRKFCSSAFISIHYQPTNLYVEAYDECWNEEDAEGYLKQFLQTKEKIKKSVVI